MFEKIPNQEVLTEMLGHDLFEVWQKLRAAIEEKYIVEGLWNTGGKKWDYEYKYRKGSKTLCGLYARKNCIGFMVILGKNERNKFESIRKEFAGSICKQYDEAQTYSDGKWIMFMPTNMDDFEEYLKLLALKRKPDKKVL